MHHYYERQRVLQVQSNAVDDLVVVVGNAVRQPLAFPPEAHVVNLLQLQQQHFRKHLRLGFVRDQAGLLDDGIGYYFEVLQYFHLLDEFLNVVDERLGRYGFLRDFVLDGYLSNGNLFLYGALRVMMTYFVDGSFRNGRVLVNAKFRAGRTGWEVVSFVACRAFFFRWQLHR